MTYVVASRACGVSTAVEVLRSMSTRLAYRRGG